MGEAAKKIPRYYWDANVFLSFIEGHADRIPNIEAILADCEEGRVEIWSSHLTIAEVAFAKAEKDAKILDTEIEKKIDELWHPESPIKLVEVSQGICVEARNLLRKNMLRPEISPRQKNKSLKAADAIHLATAQMIGVDEFHTYDKLKEFECLVPFKIEEPTAVQWLLPSPNQPKDASVPSLPAPPPDDASTGTPPAAAPTDIASPSAADATPQIPKDGAAAPPEDAASQESSTEKPNDPNTSQPADAISAIRDIGAPNSDDAKDDTDKTVVKDEGKEIEDKEEEIEVAGAIERVRKRLAGDSPCEQFARHIWRIRNHRIHMKMKSNASTSGQFPFNINPTVLSADFEVWVCSSEGDIYYLVPVAVLQSMYNDPDAYRDNTHDNLTIVSIDPKSDTAAYARGGKKEAIGEFRCAMLPD